MNLVGFTSYSNNYDCKNKKISGRAVFPLDTEGSYHVDITLFQRLWPPVSSGLLVKY